MTKTADAIAKMVAPRPELTDEQCIQIFDAVTRRNITRDVKTEVDKCATVRGALSLPNYPQNRTMGTTRKVPLTLHYWNGKVFVGGKQVHAFIAAHSRADAARVLLECGIHNCSQRYTKEFFSECWPADVFAQVFPEKDTARGVWLQRDRHRYQRLEAKP